MKRFTSQGGTIVVGLSKGEWANFRLSGAVPPAGQICPTAKPYSDDPTAKGVTVIPEEKWTDGIKNFAEYARFSARELMGVSIIVSVVHTTNDFAAAYGGGRLDFNLLRLGHRWFEQCPTEDVDRLLIHEFGHAFGGDHLSEDYHEALCLLGSHETAGAGEARRATSVPSDVMMEGNLPLDDCPATDGWSDR